MGVSLIWIGVDDTDSNNGGCTTYIALETIKELNEHNFNIIGYPRLIRLNPNVPWKTRGNGAISIQVEKGNGKRIKIGSYKGKEIYSNFKLSGKKYQEKDAIKIKNILEKIIDSYAILDDSSTNPGYVILNEQPTIDLYVRAVKDIFSIEEIKDFLSSTTGVYRGYKNCRGLIGATCSVSWRNNRDKTYELITYREKNKWGTKRFVDDKSVKDIDHAFLSTFDNFDYNNNHNRIVPNSPCPILYGIRGENENDLINAKSKVKSEIVDSWLLFETNQGTDDHLQEKSVNEISPFQSVILKGFVASNPRSFKGGHTVFQFEDNTGKIDCVAYEPTKEFRSLIRQLNIGDKIEVYGSVREEPLTINLEKIKLIEIAKIFEKIENPICSKCGKHMKSRGKNQGFKCKNCGIKSNTPTIREKKRLISTGFYEVPVCARRHISKPLKRFKISDDISK